MCKKKYQIEIKYWNHYYYMNGEPVLNAYRNREISTNSLRYLHRKIEEYNEMTPGVPLYFDRKTGKKIDDMFEYYYIDYVIERYDSLEKNTRAR